MRARARRHGETLSRGLALALLVALLTVPVAHAAERISSYDDYRSRVTRTHDAVVAAKPTVGSSRAAQDLAALVNTLLPGTERVDVGSGEIVEVDNSIVRSLVARLDASNDTAERTDTALSLEEHLGSLASALGDGANVVPANPALLKELLAQPQLSSRLSLQDLLAKWLAKVAEWLTQAFSRVFSRPGSATAVDVVLVVAAAVVVAALLFAAWMVYRNLRNALAAHDRRYLAEARYAPVVAAAEGLPADALSYAEELAAAGRFRDALRALFGGAARALVDRGLLRTTRTRTDAELLRDLAPQAPAVVPPLGDLAERFEYAWYGHVEPGEVGFESARGAYRDALGAVEATVRERAEDEAS